MGSLDLPKEGDALTVAELAVVGTTIDFRADSNGRDPDKHSRTLRSFHKLLWSKPLPNGELFDLMDNRPGAYLYHESELGRFWLASDTLAQSFSRWPRMAHLVEQLPEGTVDHFRREGGTIGGRILFPGNRVDGKMTINGARGFSRVIADRFDLTLECIRLHYRGEPSPLSVVLSRYADYFDLFGDFRGYVDFFLLQDLVSDDARTVEFFVPFEGFDRSPLPADLVSYEAFLGATLAFVAARNRRITAAVLS